MNHPGNTLISAYPRPRFFTIFCLTLMTAVWLAAPAAAQGPSVVPDIGLASSLKDLCQSEGLLTPSPMEALKAPYCILMAEKGNSGGEAGFAAGSTDKRMSLGIAHAYLGYATLIAAGVAAFSGSDDSFHCGAAYATAGLAAATTATGFYEYGYLFDRSEGISRINSHIVLGALGTAGIIAAVAAAESDSSHSGLGAGGAGAMLASVVLVKLEW